MWSKKQCYLVLTDGGDDQSVGFSIQDLFSWQKKLRQRLDECLFLPRLHRICIGLAHLSPLIPTPSESGQKGQQNGIRLWKQLQHDECAIHYY